MKQREKDRRGKRLKESGRDDLVGWLVGFLTSSSTTRLYRDKERERKRKKERDRDREIGRDRERDR